MSSAFQKTLEERLAALSPAQRALLEQKLGRPVAVANIGGDGGAILPRPATGPAPLSPAQRRMWFLDELQPDSPVYNAPLAIRFHGRLDVVVLERSLNEIVRRHDTFRTSFPVEQGERVQKVSVYAPLELSIEDLRRLPAEERDAAARRRATELTRIPFNLETGPLFTLTLLRLSEEEHFLVLNLHHIIFDGWSFGVLLRELSALYTAFSEGRPSPLPELPIQYADFSEWQQRWMRSDAYQRQLTFWKERLAGELPLLNLPLDHPRPATQRCDGARLPKVLPGEISRDLRELARTSGATLYSTLLAAFGTLLHRYTSQEDIILGSPIADRTRKETEALIGYFANTLPMRLDLSGDPTFAELLRRTQELAQGAFASQDVPFQDLVEELQPHRTASHTPLFQSAFAVQNMPLPPGDLPGVTMSALRIDNATAKFDLSLFVVDAGSRLVAAFEYNTDLFDAATIERMHGHWLTLLRGIVANPDERISALPLLTVAERRVLEVEWNATQRDYPRDACVHHLFEAQAARTPDAVAAVHGERMLTYAEVNVLSQRLAARLLREHAVTGKVVAMLMDRSLECLVGMLAVLKAGATYLPLDLSWPTVRHNGLLQDAQAVVLLKSEDLPSGDHTPVVMVNVASLAQEWDGDASTDSVAVPAEHPAYIIYTSGSTGQPKGVVIPHRAITRLVMHQDYVSLQSDDVMAHAANPAFDATTFEVWGPWLHGARIVALDRTTVLAPDELAAALDRQEITVMFLTTALFNQMARTVPAAFRKLRHLLVGGEVMDVSATRQVLEAGPPERLLNVYGPTETTTFATWHLVQELLDNAPVPIGKPIANTQCHVLDVRSQIVPVGVPGELHIGGDGVALGYLGDEALTQQRFITHPVPEASGTRLYKTGDLVRRRVDGAIEFLGRLDHQVKLRGFRIELGEIETALGQHPEVQGCVVSMHDDAAKGKQLVAHVVRQPGSTLSTTQIRRHLQTRLPDYMIPGVVTFLKSLPMTGSGKVDRQRLPAPVMEPFQASPTGADGPRDAAEAEVAGIWREVLGHANFGMHDRFFEVGGHSLLALQVIQRLEAAWRRRVAVRELFEHPTVASLACLAFKPEKFVAQDGKFLVRLRTGDVGSPIYMQPGGWGEENELLTMATLAAHLQPAQEVMGIRSRVLDESWPFPESLADHAAEALAEIQRHQPSGDLHLVGECLGGMATLELARAALEAGRVIGSLILLDAVIPPRRRYWTYRLRHDGPLARWLGGRSRQQAEEHKHPLDDLPPCVSRWYRFLLGAQPKPLDCHVHLILSQQLSGDERKIEAWRRVAKRGVTVHHVVGSHDSYIRDSAMQTCGVLRALLPRA